VNQAFATLSGRDYRFVRPARKIHWKQNGEDYWIQWTMKDDTAVLWAYDPETKKAIEVLQIRDKE